jgi:hypothetical protein
MKTWRSEGIVAQPSGQYEASVTTPQGKEPLVPLGEEAGRWE